MYYLAFCRPWIDCRKFSWNVMNIQISQVSFHDLVWWKVTGFEWNAKGIVGTSEYMIHSWEQTSLESLLHNDIGEMHISLILQCTWTRSARQETLRQLHLMMATFPFIAYYLEKNKVHGAEIVLANREMLKISVCTVCCNCESVCVCGELSWFCLMITFNTEFPGCVCTK